MSKTIKKELLYILLFIVVAILFLQSNPTFSYLQMGDYLMTEFKNIKHGLLNKMPYFWQDQYFMTEGPQTVSIHPRVILLLLTPLNIFPQVSIIFHLFVMGYSAFLFLREKRLDKYACIFGAVAIMLSNAFTTLILPGHLGKFETYAYFPLVLYFLSKAMNTGYIRYFILAGASLAVAFLGGALDVAMYFSILVGFYFIYLLYVKKGDLKITEYIKTKNKSIIAYILKFAITVILSFLMSIQVIMITRSTSEQGAAGVTNKKELYDWATRWSYPPEEVLGFILPGFFGYYSNSETHPYWGRIANMPGDEKSSNFSLTATNIGAATFIFILFALFLNRKKYNEKVFWLVASLFLIIAGFGRYFPVIYGLLFQIPIFRDARNPNKFIEIIGITLSTLSAFGFDFCSSVLKARKEDKLLNFFESKENNYKYMSIVNKTIFIITTVLLLAMIMSFLLKGSIENIFFPVWKSPKSALIARNIALSFARAFMLFLSIYLFIKNIFSFNDIKSKEKYLPALPFLGFVIVSVFDMVELNQFAILILGIVSVFVYLVYVSKKNMFNIIPIAIIVILALDLYQSSNYFVVKSETNKMYESTPIVEHIVNTGGNTTTMPILIPYLYRYTTHTMPYYDIQLTQPPAASRLSKEVSDTFDSFRINDYVGYQPRLMDLIGVRYVLSPTYLEQSVIFNELTKITEYQDSYSSAVLYELKGYREKYEFASTFISVESFDEGLSKLSSADFSIKNEVVIEDSNINTTISRPANADIKMQKKNSNETAFEVESDIAGILLFKERYDKGWKVFVDGKENRLLKANILFRGVYLEEGKHTVVFKYMPTMKYLYSTLVGYLITLATIIFSIAMYNRKKEENENKL